MSLYLAALDPSKGNPAIGALLVFLVLFGLAIYALVDRERTPNTTCSRCRGTGRRRSTMRTDAWGDCRGCDGKGYRDRKL